MKYLRVVMGVLTGVFCSATVVLTGGCAGPVPVDVNAPDYVDYTEFESVWQYLRVYSIYQERVPSDPFAFRRPEDILLAVADTLKGGNYTCYDGNPSIRIRSSTGEVMQPLNQEASSGGAVPTVYSSLPLKNTVFVDTLTDSTVRIRIERFSHGDIEYDIRGIPILQYDYTAETFMKLLPAVQHFPIVIIDLRPNGGGEIDEATAIVDAFLPADKAYIEAREQQYLESERADTTIDWHPWVTTKTARPELKGKKITVMMRDSTASASEILIAALKDCADATLVGALSYGKGIGQIRLGRRNRKNLKITFLQLRGLTGGKVGNYHRKGIVPDVHAGGSDEQWLLTAVKVHEPSATAIRKLKKRATPAVSFEPAGYRVVYEQ